MDSFPFLSGGIKIDIRTATWVPKDTIYVISPKLDEREFIVVGRITPTDVQIFHAVNNWFAEKEKWLVKRQTENAGGGERTGKADDDGRAPYQSVAVSTEVEAGSNVGADQKDLRNQHVSDLSNQKPD